MKRSWLLIPLLALFAIQIGVPLWQVKQEEAIRREGQFFKLALRPVDPYDIMRGRYLALSFPNNDVNHLALPAGTKEGDTVYAVLETGSDGLAYIAQLSADKRDHAFATTLEYSIFYDVESDPEDPERIKKMYVNIPLTRFYLPEEDAIAIDTLRFANDGDEDGEDSVRAALGVRVKDGRIVADSLWLDDQPYREWLQAHADSAERSAQTP